MYSHKGETSYRTVKISFILGFGGMAEHTITELDDDGYANANARGGVDQHSLVLVEFILFSIQLYIF